MASDQAESTVSRAAAIRAASSTPLAAALARNASLEQAQEISAEVVAALSDLANTSSAPAFAQTPQKPIIYNLCNDDEDFNSQTLANTE